MRVVKFLRLKGDERRVVVRAFILLAWSRVILWVVPFRVIHRRTANLRARDVSRANTPAFYMLAIERAARVVPGASCLTQSLAAQRLLAWAGYPAIVRFGARRNDAGGFEAHAWVECEGQIVSRLGPEDESFAPLPQSSSPPPLKDR
jgi:hypothetical protein